MALQFDDVTFAVMMINVDVLALTGETLQSLSVDNTWLAEDLLYLVAMHPASHPGSTAKLLHGQTSLDNELPLVDQGITDGSQLTLLWKPISDEQRADVLAKLTNDQTVLLSGEDMEAKVRFGFKMRTGSTIDFSRFGFNFRFAFDGAAWTYYKPCEPDQWN